MRDYGKVHSSFWSSSDMRALSEDARALAMYLLTCPHGTIAGVFRLPDGYVCDDMQWTAQRVGKGFVELLAKGFANRCETTKWVWICKHLAWNPPENPNQRKASLKIANQIPSECAWIACYIKDCAYLIGWDSPPVIEPLPNGYGTVVEPVAVTVTVAEAVNLTGGRFDEFWEAWPQSERKQDKKKCRERWDSQKLDSLADQIFSDIASRKAGQKWSDPQYIEAPVVYLNNARWEDGFTPMPAATKSADWWKSDASVIAKGQSLALHARPGESMDSFKGRVSAAAGAHA